MWQPGAGRLSYDPGEVHIGLCTSERRLQSHYFQTFVAALRTVQRFRIYELSDLFIKSTPVEDWPILDCLLVIYSPKLDLSLILSYVEKCSPYLINDVHFQHLLKNRRLMAETLQAHDIRAPPFYILDPEDEVSEYDDHIVAGNVHVHKPFIEKPLDTEDHSIAIYYTSETGRGSTLLGKANKVRSCEYLPGESRRRRDKQYLYQPFLQSDGFDVKVYAVGRDYFHAETKKSPVINSIRAGFCEKKYPVMLTSEEKEMAIKVVQAFRQHVLTFDIIRCEGKSYVVDVNTGHMVKGPERAILECARTLGLHVLRAMKKTGSEVHPERPIVEETLQVAGGSEHLCAVVAILRHGDRTPKQKVKFVTSNEHFLALFTQPKEIKIKRNEDLARLLEITRKALAEEPSPELHTVRDVLESGISEDYTPKAQVKPLSTDLTKVTKALLILKWGGTLTHAGIRQCERTGQHFRSAHYQDDETFHRLHSTYAHDIKCYSSSEGRCQMSAGAFLRGFLDLDSDVNAVATCMVRNDAPVVKMLDDSPPAAEEEATMDKLTTFLTSELPLAVSLQPFEDELPKGVMKIAKNVGNPKQYLLRINAIMESLLKVLENSLPSASICGLESAHLVYQRWKCMHERFYNASKDTFSITSLPPLSDCVRYDLLHNRELVGETGKELFGAVRFLAKLVANLEYGFTCQEKHHHCAHVIEQLMRKILADLHYWTSLEASHSEELIGDQSYHWYREVSKHTRTRIYFTSLSHLNSILCTFARKAKKWGPEAQSQLDQVISLEYLGHFVIKVYEDPRRSPYDQQRFRGEIWVSPGVSFASLDAIEDHTAPEAQAFKLQITLSLTDLEDLFSC